MDQYLADLAPRIAKFPRLAILRGALAWDRAASGSFGKDHEAALRSYDEALSHGDYWQYRRFRGDTMYWLGRFEEALADHEYWIAHGTRGGAALLAKTYDLGKLRRYAEAAETIELARKLEPTDEEIVRLATWYRGER
jgi:tetratricopeptide (TPR) repeat protein